MNLNKDRQGGDLFQTLHYEKSVEDCTTSLAVWVIRHLNIFFPRSFFYIYFIKHDTAYYLAAGFTGYRQDKSHHQPIIRAGPRLGQGVQAMARHLHARRNHNS